MFHFQCSSIISRIEISIKFDQKVTSKYYITSLHTITDDTASHNSGFPPELEHTIISITVMTCEKERDGGTKEMIQCSTR